MCMFLHNPVEFNVLYVCTACSKESLLYLEWDGFVAVMESWSSAMKSGSDLGTMLVCFPLILCKCYQEDNTMP